MIERIHAFIDYIRKYDSSFLIVAIWQESVVHLSQNLLIILTRQILNRGVNHQQQNIHDVISRVSQVQKGINCFIFKDLIAIGV